ncbi:bifunctional folylpolyglutamate synthase/dihydrofolate synthase [Polymorphum gilvum]|uniref:tetrahydrofolate synthase n=1 Tax=Polymorphum gilvum (strain LMG 25793 / CGMCC 1.9160 / SL003B-26A1) TaxID=991905 RepID=F2IYH4_POLGS|nr:folylpolyglutamate synthase/dihydrofolate synthase family protein [Polymorphum gilvum]ADZ68487.1 Probable folc bifunctional folylpolyglutamate synthase / dihydrofolate synthase [Polymorphum gilvum SL003B-26A1]
MDQITAILDRLLALHPRQIDLSLERMHRLLAALGHPERRLPPTIHVAGTNGKGSVTATMRAILEASGRRCHVYTSPHLVAFNERIRLGDGGRLVSDPRLIAALDVCEEANAGNEITFFEITTAAALLLFAEEPADVLLLEVGLGGRLDATNVVDAPLCSVLTAISLDHEKFLGNTLAEIAAEKAAILKPGCPVVVAPQEDEAMAVIERAAVRTRSPLARFGQEFVAYADRGRLVFEDDDGLSDLPLPVLPGAHQVVNAGVAVAALKAAGLWPGEADAARGLKAVYWPGRLQALTHGPVVDKCPPGAEVWLDGGHNPGAALTVAAYMGDLEERSPRRLYLVTGMLTTKDPVGFFRAFHGLARHVATVPIQSTNAARDPFELADFARIAGLEATPFDGLDAALADIRACAARDGVPPRILICGSLYLVGDTLSANGMAPR